MFLSFRVRIQNFVWTLEVVASVPNLDRLAAIYRVITNTWNVTWKLEPSKDGEPISVGPLVSSSLCNIDVNLSYLERCLHDLEI